MNLRIYFSTQWLLFTRISLYDSILQAGQSPLVYATSRGFEPLALTLIEGGAAVNQADNVSGYHV